MKRASCLLMLAAGFVMMTGASVAAALQPTPMVPAFESTGEVMNVARLRNRGLRFRVRASRYRRGGFSRGACPPEGAAPVVPMVEGAESVDKAPAYLTASAHPTFFVSVPALSNATGVVFIEDPNSESRNPQIYKANFTLNTQKGIVGISMPSDAPSLEEGSSYRWKVVIQCGAEENSNDTMIIPAGGEIERTADISGTPEERLEYYLDEGVWQETVEILARERFQAGTAAADEDWQVLMEASGIPQFAETPIVAMVTAQLTEN